MQNATTAFLHDKTLAEALFLMSGPFGSLRFSIIFVFLSSKSDLDVPLYAIGRL